jgi:streptogramin lyase
VATLTTLPRSAQISQFVAGRAYVYALDVRHGDLYAVRLFGEPAAVYRVQFAKPVSSVAVGIDDRLWIGLSGASYLLRFDPLTKHMDSFELQGAQVSMLTTDALGRIFYADDARNTVGTLDASSGRITEHAFPRHGVTTALVVDGSSTLWLGNSAGEIWAVRGGTQTLTVGLQRPVTTLSLDASGRAWYLSPLPSGAIGFGYAAADGAHAGQTVAGPAFSLSFSALGRAWLADPRGGFWVSTGSQ